MRKRIKNSQKIHICKEKITQQLIKKKLLKKKTEKRKIFILNIKSK